MPVAMHNELEGMNIGEEMYSSLMEAKWTKKHGLNTDMITRFFMLFPSEGYLLEW